MPTVTLYRQLKATVDILLMTHYYKKKGLEGISRLLHIQLNASHMLIKRSEAAVHSEQASPFVWHYSV